MTTTTTPNADTLETLQLENLQLREKLAWYEEQFRLYKQKQFAASSERFDDQGHLFNEAEELAEEPVSQEPDTQKVPAHERKKPVRKPLPEDLPRDVVVLDIADAEKTCTCCGKPLKAFGHESSCKLDIVPAQVKVIEFQRKKYACEDECCVKTAPAPRMP
ncbi:IS66 family transposase, partial [Sansalvadorimonas verongulae]|uniref:IS66 family transposase n=1 Tax=Sansalvadorimonas verongulae TaxID=2172824 RepID=UPI0018AD0F8A